MLESQRQFHTGRLVSRVESKRNVRLSRWVMLMTDGMVKTKSDWKSDVSLGGRQLDPQILSIVAYNVFGRILILTDS